MSSWEIEMVDRLHGAVNGEKDRIIAEYQQMTGLSPSTLYRRAKARGYATGRKKRKDLGVLQKASDGQVDYVAGLIRATARDNKGGIMPVERAMEIAEDSGILDEKQMSVSRMQTLLREREISAGHFTEATPHVVMRSLHPNEVHLVDASVCIQYYLKSGKLRLMREAEFYKNRLDKFAKLKTRLMRYLLVDHFSGAFHLRYYDASGESANLLFHFLCEAWLPKEDPRLPLHGVPTYVLWDAGSAALSKPMQGMLSRLGVLTPDSLPHNPRRQGAVETMHNVVERWFESSLKIQPATSVEELNDWARDWMIHFQATHRHTRHQQPRTPFWLQIKPEELRVTTREMLQMLYHREPETRRVDGTRSISFDSKTYRLRHIEGIRPGVEVQVLVRAWNNEVSVLWNDEEYVVTPVEILPASLGCFPADAVHIGHEFKAQPETATQQAAKRLDNLAYGEERKKGQRPFAGAQVYGHHADKVANLTPMPKKSTPLEISRDIAPSRLPITELFKRLIAAGVRIDRQLNQELREHYGESIDAREAAAVVEAVSSGNPWRQGSEESRRAVL